MTIRPVRGVLKDLKEEPVLLFGGERWHDELPGRTYMALRITMVD
jgi:hypothetical protein